MYIHALRINGSFDDCQRLVKTAFLRSCGDQPYPSEQLQISTSVDGCYNRSWYSEAYRQLSTESQTTTILCTVATAGNIEVQAW